MTTKIKFSILSLNVKGHRIFIWNNDHNGINIITRKQSRLQRLKTGKVSGMGRAYSLILEDTVVMIRPTYRNKVCFLKQCLNFGVREVTLILEEWLFIF